MPYRADGFDFFYTHRGSWKAERRLNGRTLDVVPVTWTKGRRQGATKDDVWQEVWFQNREEMETRRLDHAPFVVAVAMARDYNKFPHSPLEFRSCLEVQSTGVALSDNSIETKVLRRINARQITSG